MSGERERQGSEGREQMRRQGPEVWPAGEEGQRRRTGGEGVLGAGSVGAYGLPDPGHIFADLGVHGRVLGRAAGVDAPGEDAL